MSQEEPQVGDVIDQRYVVLRILGQGAFGQVYLCQDQVRSSLVAVKFLLLKKLREWKYRRRFLHEAQILARLQHPFIVSVHAWKIQANLAYLVLDYVSGGTLQTRLDAQAGPLPSDEIVRLLEYICPALDYIHQEGVVHLDLKPANVLLDVTGQAFLADFGVAHLLREGAAEGGSSLDMGTPEYYAPERVTGQPERRSDLYALGVMLFQMLTGQVPFSAADWRVVLRKQEKERPPALRSLRPDLGQEWETIVKKALAKKPEKRYQSARELLEQVRSALTPPPLSSFVLIPGKSGPQAPPPVFIPGKKGVPAQVAPGVPPHMALTEPQTFPFRDAASSSDPTLPEISLDEDQGPAVMRGGLARFIEALMLRTWRNGVMIAPLPRRWETFWRIACARHPRRAALSAGLAGVLAQLGSDAIIFLLLFSHQIPNPFALWAILAGVVSYWPAKYAMLIGRRAQAEWHDHPETLTWATLAFLGRILGWVNWSVGIAKLFDYGKGWRMW